MVFSWMLHEKYFKKSWLFAVGSTKSSRNCEIRLNHVTFFITIFLRGWRGKQFTLNAFRQVGIMAFFVDSLDNDNNSSKRENDDENEEMEERAATPPEEENDDEGESGDGEPSFMFS